jgi:hypothetical protein
MRQADFTKCMLAPADGQADGRSIEAWLSDILNRGFPDEKDRHGRRTAHDQRLRPRWHL